MEERLARLETRVEHIQTDVTDIKIELRRQNDKIDSVKGDLASAKIWALMLYFAQTAALLGVMARGFGWLD